MNKADAWVVVASFKPHREHCGLKVSEAEEARPLPSPFFFSSQTRDLFVSDLPRVLTFSRARMEIVSAFLPFVVTFSHY